MVARVRESWVGLSAGLIVGWRQVRDTWRLLLVASLGITLAVALTILLPYYAYLTLDARLHHILSTADPNLTISVDLPSRALSPRGAGIAYATRDQNLRSLVQHQLG